MDKILRNTWVSVATKVGGQLALIGGEFTEGTMINLYNMKWRYDFNIDALRWGFGAGLGAGYVIVFAFNCVSPQQLDQTRLEDWGVNIAVGGKLDAAAKALGRLKLSVAISRIAVSMALPTLQEAQTIRNAAHYLYSASEIKGTNPKIVSIDTPIAVGAEISVVGIYGKFKVGENQSIR